jgi:hypothetical protein
MSPSLSATPWFIGQKVIAVAYAVMRPSRTATNGVIP